MTSRFGPLNDSERAVLGMSTREDDERADEKAEAKAAEPPPICKECGGLSNGNCPGCWDTEDDDE